MLPAAGSGYSAKDVAKLLDVSVGQVRGYVQAGLVEGTRGERGEYRFSFQDLVLLRAAKGLVGAHIPRTRIRRALQHLQEVLPRGRSLSGMQIEAEGDRVVVHDGTKRWNPESGQMHFRFDVADLARRAAPIARQRAAETWALPGQRSADEWYEIARELEVPSPEDARETYRRALAIDANHAPSHVNLGRLLHEAGDAPAAEEHYRKALEIRPQDATAAFNLGVALEDQGREVAAVSAYKKAILADPGHADAHFNAAGLCKKLGRHEEALSHMKSYRSLMQD